MLDCELKTVTVHSYDSRQFLTPTKLCAPALRAVHLHALHTTVHPPPLLADCEMSSPTPPWVLHMLRDLVERRKTVEIIAGLISHAGYDCTPRQVKRWKLKHKLSARWDGDDQALDGIVEALRREDELGANEGYRWCHSVVNQRLPAGKSVGAARVCQAQRRTDPAGVALRKRIVEKQLQRRVYVADYYGQSDHIDLECKVIVGNRVRIYIYGQVLRARLEPRLAAVARKQMCTSPLEFLH